jgi:hypothetical protein
MGFLFLYSPYFTIKSSCIGSKKIKILSVFAKEFKNVMFRIDFVLVLFDCYGH